MFRGGDGYAPMTKGTSIIDPSAAILMASMVMGQVALAGTVHTEVDGRIRRLD
jgi:hypothetical protein